MESRNITNVTDAWDKEEKKVLLFIATTYVLRKNRSSEVNEINVRPLWAGSNKNNPAGKTTKKLTIGLYQLYTPGRMVITMLKSKLKGAAIRHPCVQPEKLKLHSCIASYHSGGSFKSQTLTRLRCNLALYCEISGTPG